MTSPRKQISFIFTVVTTTLIMACSEDTTSKNQTEAVAPTVTETNITQLPNDTQMGGPAPQRTQEEDSELQKEVKEGNSDAQYDLAYRYEHGLGVPKNEAKALELYQDAEHRGHSEVPKNPNATSTPE